MVSVRASAAGAAWSWAAGTSSPRFRNPPAKYLEREVKRFPDWLTWQALTLPRLEVLQAEVEPLGADTWKRAPRGAEHAATCPTLRHQARARAQGHARRGLRDRAAGGRGARRAASRASRARSSRGAPTRSSLQAFLPNLDLTGDRGQCEWTVRAPAGHHDRRSSARHDRAGRVAARRLERCA